MCYENAYYIASWVKKVSELNLDAWEKIELLEVTQEDFFNFNFGDWIVPFYDLERMINEFKKNPETMKVFNSLK